MNNDGDAEPSVPFGQYIQVRLQRTPTSISTTLGQGMEREQEFVYFEGEEMIAIRPLREE
jgi:hypothetical protein